jgi:hypothetical protein
VPRTNPTNPNGADPSAYSLPLARVFPAIDLSNQMETLIINAHLNYPGWSEGKLNLAFMDMHVSWRIQLGSREVRYEAA